MNDAILHHVSKPDYRPVKPKVLARQLGIADEDYNEFRRALKEIFKQGQIEFGPGHSVRGIGTKHTVTGIFRQLPSGRAVVRPHAVDGKTPTEVAIAAESTLDASTGDEVLVKLSSRRGSEGRRFGAVIR